MPRSESAARLLPILPNLYVIFFSCALFFLLLFFFSLVVLERFWPSPGGTHCSGKPRQDHSERPIRRWPHQRICAGLQQSDPSIQYPSTHSPSFRRFPASRARQHSRAQPRRDRRRERCRFRLEVEDRCHDPNRDRCVESPSFAATPWRSFRIDRSFEYPHRPTRNLLHGALH